MLSSFYRHLVNIFFLTPLAVSRYIKKNPNEKIIVAGGCKARRFKEDKEVRSEVGWAVSRRSNLILTDKNLACGDWIIPINSISEAILLRVRSFFAKAFVLKIKVQDGMFYQFGLQYDPNWESQKVLTQTIMDSKIKLSALSLTLRIFLLIWVIWYLLKYFGIMN